MKLQILDFTARWCGPCKTLKPVLQTLSTEYKADLVEVDVDDDPTQAQLYDVRAMPTVVLIRDGKEVGRFVGARTKQFVAGMLDRALDGDTAIASP
ncbi:MAG TPA: thioredoxin family protein [Kofleriaceae bacterium]